MTIQVQFRRDTAAAWAASNPVLSQGEIGLDLTNSQFKIGDGVRTWNALGYWSEGNAFSKTEIVATAGQTVFRANHSGMVDVERNGFSLLTADYVLGSDVGGPKVTLTTPCEAGDVVVVRVWKTFSVAGVLPLTGGSLSGPLSLPELNAGGTVTADSLVLIGNSNILLPRGTTAQRPGTPVGGMLRYNTETLAIEGYNGEAWTGLTPGASMAPVSLPSLYAMVDADIRKVWTAPDSLASKLQTQSVTEDYFYTFYFWFVQPSNQALIDPLVNTNVFNNIFKSVTVLEYLMRWQEGWDFVASSWNTKSAAYAELYGKLNLAFFQTADFQTYSWKTANISGSGVSVLTPGYVPADCYSNGDLLTIASIDIKNTSSTSSSGSCVFNTGYGADIALYNGTLSAYADQRIDSLEFSRDVTIFGNVTAQKLNVSASTYFSFAFNLISVKRPTQSVTTSTNPYL